MFSVRPALKQQAEPSKIVRICPICGKAVKERYSKEKEIRYSSYGTILGVNLLEHRGDVLLAYFPCAEHRRAFADAVNGYVKYFEKVRKEYAKALREALKEARAEALRQATKKVDELVTGIGNGEGIVVWVCNGSHSDGDADEVYYVAVRDGWETKEVAGSRKPHPAYRFGGRQTSTHRVAREILRYVSHYRTAWKGYVQGLPIGDCGTLRDLIMLVFILSRRFPSWTLVDFFRNTHYWCQLALGARLRGAVDGAEKDPVVWGLVGRSALEEKARAEIVAKYGIDPSKYPDAKDIFPAPARARFKW